MTDDDYDVNAILLADLTREDHAGPLAASGPAWAANAGSRAGCIGAFVAHLAANFEIDLHAVQPHSETEGLAMLNASGAAGSVGPEPHPDSPHVNQAKTYGIDSYPTGWSTR